MNLLQRVTLAAALTTLVAAIAIPTALAHTGITATSPRAGSTRTKPPAKVTVTFSEQIRGGSLVVRRNGTLVSKGRGGRDPANVRRLRGNLNSGLGAGRYTVRWTIEAADGDEQTGSFMFRVR